MLRVFFTLSELNDSNGKVYKRTKTHQDFPPDVTPEAAYAELHHKHGKVDECTMWDKELGVWITPPKYVEVISHSLVDVDREQVVLPSDKTFEVPLFDGVTLKECLQDSPNLKSKKFAQRRKKR